MYLEHRLSALLRLHLHSELNIWFQWIGQRQLQDETTISKVFGFDATYIRYLTVNMLSGPHSSWEAVASKGRSARSYSSIQVWQLTMPLNSASTLMYTHHSMASIMTGPAIPLEVVPEEVLHQELIIPLITLTVRLRPGCRIKFEQQKINLAHWGHVRQ